MQKFIQHIGLLLVLVFVTMLLVFSRINGYSDAYYLKLTSDKKSNLILGTSKALQGIQPTVLQNNLHKSFYNYAFAISISPYGSIYYSSIMEKLDTEDTNQTFILAVDPWSLSSLTKNPNDSSHFREKKACLKDARNPKFAINFSYLFRYFDESFYFILKNKSTTFLHDDGWLEVTLNEDSISVNRRIAFSTSLYASKIENYHFSTLRYSYLLKTITFLQQYGSVYLVRLPVHEAMLEVENELSPNFNTIIQTAIDSSTAYFDLTSKNNDFTYTDGIHLTKESGKEVSMIISDWIWKLEQK